MFWTNAYNIFFIEDVATNTTNLTIGPHRKDFQPSFDLFPPTYLTQLNHPNKENMQIDDI